jgi:O-antigen/teichoic acid export membrane protein
MVGNLARLALVTAIALSLWAGAGMETLGLVYVAAIVASWSIMITHQRRRYPDLRYGVSWPDRDALKDLVAVAPLYAVVPAAMLVTTHATIILISSLAAAGKAVVMYSTMRTLTGVARMVMDQLMHVTGVEIARQFAQGDRRALTTLYDFMARLSGGICGTLAGLIAIIGPPFLTIWTVGKVPFDGAIFWPLLGAAGLAGPSVAGVSVLLFINRPGGMARAYAVAGGVTLCLCLVLIPPLGAAGAAWAVLVAETCILSIVIPMRTAKIVGGSPVRLIALIQGIAVISFAISSAIAWLALSIVGGSSLAGLILVGAIWAALVSAPLYFLIFNRPRRQWIADRLRDSLGR